MAPRKSAWWVSGPFAILTLESVLRFFVSFELPKPMLRALYPSYSTLERHCLAHTCTYDPSWVGTLYVIQFVTLIGFGLLLIPFARSAGRALPGSLSAVLALVIAGSFIDYVHGNFSFHPTWILPNSVTESPLGLFRFAVLFSLAAVAMVLFAMPPQPTDAPTR